MIFMVKVMQMTIVCQRDKLERLIMLEVFKSQTLTPILIIRCERIVQISNGVAIKFKMLLNELFRIHH